MDEARGLQYSISFNALTERAEEKVRNLLTSIGRLRAEAEGDTVDIDVDTGEAEGRVENLSDIIGNLGNRDSDIIIDADTSDADESIRDLTENLGDLQDQDIDVDADTEDARRNIRDLTEDLGDLEDHPPDIDVDVDTDEARRNLRDLHDDADDLEDDAGGIGAAFRKSFLAGVDGGNSFSSSLRSGVGGAFTYAKDKATEFKDDVVSRMKGMKDSVVDGAESIKNGFTHPIDTIKNGLGGAIDSAKSRFIDFIRGAEDAADAADDVGDSSAGARPDVESLGDAAESSGGKFEKLGDILKSAGKAVAVGLTAATVAVGGFAAASVNVGMTFDSSMSQVAATMGYTVEQLNDASSEASQNYNQLREFAQEMGAKTAFSASQAADALNYMALAGYDAETSMTMLPNVLNLAAAGGIELAAASDMVTDASSALGLSLDETSMLVDQMAAASSKSNTSVQQLGDAILTVGGTAKNLAGGTTELSTMLGVLADNGVKGAEGGTALRNVILSLSAPTDKAAAALQSLGINAFDSEGNLRPLNETFGDLNGALSTMTQEERTQVLNEIFNKVDLKSVNALLGTSAERFEELGLAIDGAWLNVDSLAESLTDVGLDLTTMQGNISKLGISESQFNDILKQSGGNASAFADGLLEAADAGVSQADILSALGGDLEELQVAFDNTTGAAQAMADTQLDNLAGDITLFQSALEGAQIVISDQLTPSLRNFTQFGTDAVTRLSDAFQEGGLTGAMGALGGILSDGLGMIIDMLPTAIDAGMQLLGALGQGLLDNTPVIISAAIQIVTMLGDGILRSLPVIAGAAVEIIASLASGLGDMLPELIPTAVSTVILIAEAIIGNLPLLLDAGMKLIGGLADGIIAAIPVLVGQLPELVTQILDFLSEGLPTFMEQGATLLLSIADGLIGAIPMLVEQLPELISSIVGFVTENLPTILEQGVEILTTLATGLIGALPQLISQLPLIITGIVGGLSESFPEIMSTGVNLLLELAAGIISAIPQLVSQLPAVGAAILGAFGEIPGLVIDVGKNIVEGLWSGISSMASWVGDKVKEFAGNLVGGIKDFLGIHSPSTVFADIGENSGLGVGVGFTRIMKDVSEDMQDAIPTNLDGPEIDVAEPNLPNIKADYANLGNAAELPTVPDVTFGVNPVVEGIEAMGEVADVAYNVIPVIEDIKTPPVNDLTYSVSPLVQEYNPQGYDPQEWQENGGDAQETNPEGSVGGDEVKAGGTGTAEFTFAPVITIPITVEGNADSEALDELRAQLESELEAKMRELFEEFRREELENMALKNQYAF